jgi:hypothetical protein
MFQFSHSETGSMPVTTHKRLPVLAGITLAAALLAVQSVQAADPTYSVGTRKTVIADKGAGGLTQFPETPIVILATTPEYKVLIATGLRTVLAKGPSMDKLVASGVALAPSNTKGTFDEVSTHISGVWKDPASSDIYAMFNANDSDNVPRIPGGLNGYRGRYFTTAVAKSTDGGATFKKIGPVLSIPKNASADPLQGDAFASVVMSADKQYLYAYYGDMYNAPAHQGVQTCLARATVASNGLPGSWKKYYNGEFVTPGISVLDTNYMGAETTPVVTPPGLNPADAMYPHVSYSEKTKMYIMVYAVNDFSELHDVVAPGPDTAKPVISGIYISYSKDGINWTGQHQLNTYITIDYPGREVALHPTFVVDEATSSATEVHGTLYYGYSINMWFGTPSTQYLASQSVDVTAIPADFLTTGIAPQAAQAKTQVGEYRIRQAGLGQWVVNFKTNDVKSLRLGGINGAAAGKTEKIGSASYRLQVANPSAPLFLQGTTSNSTFTKSLMLP